MAHFLGIDIGGTKTAVCLGDDAGRILDKRAFATEERRGPQQTIDNILRAGREILAAHAVRPAGVGIACGSPLDAERGIVQAPANLPSWRDVPIARIASDAFAAPAWLENDANAGAIAEHSFGAGRGCQHLVFCTMGTGMGAGLILNGRIYRGANVYAGEIGHLRLERYGPVGCRKAGSFEGFCSGGGIAQVAHAERMRWRDATCLPERPTAREVGEGALAGDALSLAILELVGHYLGIGLSFVLDILNPERVVIGSIFARCERFLRPAMERALAAEALPQTVAACTILPAQLGEAIGDYAALAVAFDQVKRRSSAAAAAG